MYSRPSWANMATPMIPLWSSVELNTADERLLADLESMRVRSGAAPLDQRVSELKERVFELLEEELINEAYEITRQSLPDARIFVQPLITWRTIHSTPHATANATLRFLTELLANNQRPLSRSGITLGGSFLKFRVSVVFLWI